MVNSKLLLSMDSTRYCTGDSWKMSVSHAAPKASVRVVGNKDSQPWEIVDWRATGEGGSLSETGIYRPGDEGTYRLYVVIGDAFSNAVSLTVTNCTVRLSLNEAEYCIGDPWILKVTGNVTDTWTDLLGTTDGEPWEISMWRRTASDGSLTEAGVFAPGREGTHTFRVRIGGVLSNTVTIGVRICGP
jgi:hypothetical protein